MFSRVLSVAAVALLGFGLMSSTPVFADSSTPQSVDVMAPPVDNVVAVPATPDTPDPSTTEAVSGSDDSKDTEDKKDGEDSGDAKEAPATDPTE